MAGKIGKSGKQILSLLFHGAVLLAMVTAYDLSKGLAEKLGWIESAKPKQEVEIDILAKGESLATEIDPELEKLVDGGAEGYRFRRDLAFPPHLKVIATEVKKLDKVRFSGKSEFGEGTMVLTTRDDEVMEYELAGREVRFTMTKKVLEKQLSAAERLARIEAVAEAEKAGQAPPEENHKIVDRLVGKTVKFGYNGSGWDVRPSGEVATMAWGKGLLDEVTPELRANGLLPRVRWFGEGRMALGAVTNLSDKSLDLVFDGGGQGKLEMVFTGVEGVHGHPCGVFEVKGRLILEGVDGEGQALREERTVEGGKIWCSLLYPAVLRMDLDLIISKETREGGKLVSQKQGDSRYELHREWVAVTPVSGGVVGAEGAPEGGAAKKY